MCSRLVSSVHLRTPKNIHESCAFGTEKDPLIDPQCRVWGACNRFIDVLISVLIVEGNPLLQLSSICGLTMGTFHFKVFSQFIHSLSYMTTE